MDARHLRFGAALAVFAAWVLALAMLAATSGSPPVPKAMPGAKPAQASAVPAPDPSDGG